MTYDEFKQKYGEREKSSRKGKPVRHQEDDIQKACVKWFRDHYPTHANLLFHPNNEAYFGGWGKTEQQRINAGNRAKAMGVTPGVADLILMHQQHDHQAYALCIELKTKTGKQSDNQKEWQKAVTQQGYRYEIVRTLADFQRLIEDYLHILPLPDEKVLLAKIFNG